MLFDDFDVVTADIPHPTIPGMSVKVRRLDDIEKMEYYTSMKQYVKVVPVMHPETKELLWDKDERGNRTPVTVPQDAVPMEALLDLLKKSIQSWTGFDAKNKVTGNVESVPYHASKAKVLFSSKLDFEEKNPKFGEPDEPEFIKNTYWNYLIGKILEGQVFSDPLAPN